MEKSLNNITHYTKQLSAFYDVEVASHSLFKLEEPQHFHDYYIVKIPVRGVDKIVISNNSFVYPDNQIVILNPGETHAVKNIVSSSTSFYTVSIYPDALVNLMNKFHSNISNDYIFQRCAGREILEKSMLLFSVIEEGDKNDRLLVEEVFYDWLQCLFFKIPETQKKYTDSRIKKLKNYIDEHYMDDNLSLDHFSKIVFLSPYQIINLFKEYTCLSPFAYVINKRIEKAAKLLKQGNSVLDVAYSCGFYDLPHFNKYFKKFYKTSPTSFQKNLEKFN